MPGANYESVDDGDGDGDDGAGGTRQEIAAQLRTDGHPEESEAPEGIDGFPRRVFSCLGFPWVSSLLRLP